MIFDALFNVSLTWTIIIFFLSFSSFSHRWDAALRIYLIVSHQETNGQLDKEINTNTFTNISFYKSSNKASQDATKEHFSETDFGAMENEIQAQGGTVGQHDQLTFGRFPTRLTHWQWRPHGQLWWPFLLKNGPQPSLKKLSKRAEPLSGLLAATQAPSSQPGRSRGPWEPRVGSGSPGLAEEEVQLSAPAGHRGAGGGAGWHDGVPTQGIQPEAQSLAEAAWVQRETGTPQWPVRRMWSVSRRRRKVASPSAWI